MGKGDFERINGKEFSVLFAKEYGVSQEYAAAICKGVFSLLGKTIYEDNMDVSIQRFGTFKHYTLSDRHLKHPLTGEEIIAPGRIAVRFCPPEKTKIEAYI